jgi:hypothetical protein
MKLDSAITMRSDATRFDRRPGSFKGMLAGLWGHPRRTGFIAFNLFVVLAFLASRSLTAGVAQAGLAGVPNVVLGYAGMTFVTIAWAIAWGAWAGRQTNLWLHNRAKA